MSWDLYMLEDICDVINGGSWSQVEYISEGVKVIKVSNLVNDGIDESNMSFLPLESLSVYEKNILKSYDLVVTTVGSHPQLKASAAGRGFIISPAYEGSLLNQNCVCIRTKNDKILFNRYLGYIGRSDDFRHYIQQTGRGAANQMRIPISNIKSYELSLPPLQTQKRIASILSAYDDLIENNLKRIKLLEETAQYIYKEWFVNFRFPNYENTPINQETSLPEGWEVLTVKDYCEIISRGATLDYNGDDALIPVLNQSCIRNGEIDLEKIRFACPLKENKEYCYTKLNDILINSMGDGTLGRVSKNNSIEDKYIIHNCITFMRAKDNYSQPMLYGFISTKQDYFISVAQGSTGQSTLNLNLINELKINTPSGIILKEFDKIILPIWQQIGVLKRENKKLKEARDILLPRLMNRTIEV